MFAEKIFFVDGNCGLQQLWQYFAFVVILQKEGILKCLIWGVLPGRVGRDAKMSSAARPPHPGAALAIGNPHHLGYSPPVNYISSACVMIPVNLIHFSRGLTAMEQPMLSVWGVWTSRAVPDGLPLWGPRAQPSEVLRPCRWGSFGGTAAAHCLPASGPDMVLFYRGLLSCASFPDSLIYAFVSLVTQGSHSC